MRKVVSLLLVVVLVMGFVGMVSAEEAMTLEVSDFQEEYLAAPAVAGMLLEAAGLDNRYGSGKDGGNYIKDVANHMGPETNFDGVTKEEDLKYACAVARFLKDQGANVLCPCRGILDPVASNAIFVDNEDRTGTMFLTAVDLCGNGIEGLTLADIDVDIQWVGLSNLGTLHSQGYWNIYLDDKENGNYEIIFHRLGRVPYTRNWDVLVMSEVIESGLYVKVSNPATVYTLNITSVNNNTGYTHNFIITYYYGTDEGTGVGSNNQVVSDIVFDENQISFKSVYTNNYTWYPAFILEDDGTLTYVNLGGDNVYAATGTWSEQ